MSREYVPIFFEWLDVTQDLTAEEKGNLIDAVVSYASGKEYEHLLTGGCRIAFRFLKGQVDRNTKIAEERSKAGSNKKDQDQAKDNKQNQKETNANKPEQNKTNFPKEKEKDKEKEKEKEKDKEKESRRFTPPTLNEVQEYCRERGNQVNPERFIDFYASKGWRVGNQPMKDWKACVRTWEQRDKNTSSVKQVVAQQYQQRDYSQTRNPDDILDMLEVM